MGSLNLETVILDLGIIIFGVVVFLKMTHYSGIFKKIKKDTYVKFEETRNEATIARGTGNVGYEVIQKFNVQRMDDVRKNFNEESAHYISWVQTISLFPLLGLLGTVIGLLRGLGSLTDQNFDVLYSSLSTALSSTLIGILCAIVLKIVATFGPSRIANEIEDTLVENDREYTNLLNFHKLSED